jgi:Ferritin-like domain
LIHEDEIKAHDEKVANRRAFLKSAGFTGLGLAAAGMTAGKLGAFDNSSVGKALGMRTPSVKAAEDIDLEILNFALNLEYLEAEFYSKATTGKTAGELGAHTGGVGNYGPNLTLIAEELCNDELTHVNLIHGALGKFAVTKPTIDLAVAGTAFAGPTHFLTFARAFEDVGVSAYGGAAPLITSKTYLQVAAQIAEVEANHSGAIRLLCALLGISVSPLDALDVIPPPAGKDYFVTNSDALAVIRTTSQVLAIAYGNSTPGTTGGGFFPNGVNGSINTV